MCIFSLLVFFHINKLPTLSFQLFLTNQSQFSFEKIEFQLKFSFHVTMLNESLQCEFHEFVFQL